VNAVAVAALWLGLAAVLPAQVDAAVVAQAVADYRAGRHETAHAAFAAQFAAAGDDAPAALRWNLALAALRVQRSGDAEATMQPWLAGEDPQRRAEAEFVVAMASFQRAERAALAAQLPDAEPMAWTLALQAMEKAAAGFLRSAAGRGGWPEAERNAERARARLAELQKIRDAAQQAQAKQEPEPPPPAPPAPQPEPEEAGADVTKERLGADQVARLLARVERKEREKRQQRRAEQLRATAAGERGW
jgi:hypothetical protein